MGLHAGIDAKHTDILVIGGGPAGSTVALALARAGLAVVVVERSNYRGPRVGEHLTPSCRPALERIGSWASLPKSSHLSSPGVRIAWGSATASERDYFFNAYGEGWNLDRPTFDAALAQAAASAGAELLTATRLSALRRQGNRWIGTLETSGRRLLVSARLVVDASGRAAILGRLLGCHRLTQDHLVGLAAWQHPAVGMADTCTRLIVEAVEDGWWYATPLPDGGVVAAFMTDRDLVPGNTANAEQRWADRINETQHIRSIVEGRGSRRHFQVCAANTYMMSSIAGAGWLAVGDAASAYDPLSSMGIRKAVEEAGAAAHAILQSLAGDHEALCSHAAMVAHAYKRYLDERCTIYGQERRWQEHIFWRRRQDQTQPTAVAS